MAHTFNDEILLYTTGVRGIGMTSIAFTSDRDGEGIKELYLMDYDGYGQRRMSGHRSLSFSPAWSPSGEGLAYVSYYAGAGASLYWVDRATGDKRPILEEDPQALSPTVAPSGDYIAFAKSLRGNLEIFRIDRDGSNLRRLTTSGGIDTNPAWSPRGDRIAFTSSRSGSPQIYVMRRDGSGLRRLTFNGNYNTAPAWSPDGRWIAYETRVSGKQFDIWLIDPEGEVNLPIVSHRRSDESPSWSPDSRKIAFSSTRRGRADVYVVDANGENLRRLTQGQGENLQPDWGPFAR